MKGDSSRKIDKALFEAASAIDDPETRQAFLAMACGGTADSARLTRVTEWLGEQDFAETFFRNAAIDRAAVSFEVAEEMEGDNLARNLEQDDDDPGSRIDRYRLLERIGEGGSGVVYLAEQLEPVQRRVALKVIRSGLDGTAVPKVIDFGISRAVEGGSAEETVATAHGQFVGTPAYMSPEQAEGGQDPDTRGDVYSLGVLLYELLTGRTPFDVKRLTQAGLFEMLRILREEEPPAPSVVLSRLGTEELAAVAAARDCPPGAWATAMRGDLDGIVAKAMAKDRESRYDTVNGLAMDLRRFLNDEPVTARPPGRLYLFRKLLRRNKLVFAAAAAVTLALFGGFAVSSWFYVREREARQVQVRLREAAEAARASEARLLQQSKARESVSLAAIRLAEGKIEEADALLSKTPLASIEPSREAASLFLALGDWNAIRQRTRMAADCYALFLQANRLDKSPIPQALSMSPIGIGTTLAEAEKTAEYERFREETIAHNEKVTNLVTISSLLKASLLTPADEAFLARVRPMAVQLATVLSTPNHPQDMGAVQGAWGALSLAMMAYRSGDFTAVLAWRDKYLAYPDANESRACAIHAVAAMAAQQLGRTDQARTELVQAREGFAGPFNRDVMFPRGEGNGVWLDWSIARVLLHEAQSAVVGTALLPSGVITLVNPSFESPDIADGTVLNNGVYADPGWSGGGVAVLTYLVDNGPSQNAFFGGAVPHGQQALSLATGFITQQLNDDVNGAVMTKTSVAQKFGLSFYAARRAGGSGAGSGTFSVLLQAYNGSGVYVGNLAAQKYCLGMDSDNSTIDLGLAAGQWSHQIDLSLTAPANLLPSNNIRLVFAQISPYGSGNGNNEAAIDNVTIKQVP
ncbi:MAG: protein kinase [Luteolibacter sp.]